MSLLKKKKKKNTLIKRYSIRVSKKSRNPCLPPFDSLLFFIRKTFFRRWTCKSSSLGILRFVQTDFPTSRSALYSGTMRWRYSWGGDALWVSCMFIFENVSRYEIIQSLAQSWSRPSTIIK